MHVRVVTQELPPLTLPPSKTPRSEGVHQSAIIRCIATEAGILKPEWAEELSLVDVRTITDPLAILRISIGLAWEQYYIPLLPDVVDHPDEMFYDGVYMSKDGESVSVIITSQGQRVQLLVHEVKATYKSLRRMGDLSEQWMWLAQLKGYCLASGTRFARLHVLFLCGDYTYPMRPRLEIWDIEFTQEELDNNWTVLTEYRDEFMSRETDGVRGAYE